MARLCLVESVNLGKASTDEPKHMLQDVKCFPIQLYDYYGSRKRSTQSVNSLGITTQPVP
eukprot:4075558-Karenia_brevis.AAC.2